MTRTVLPYELPHACESFELAATLAQLDREQVRALRSFMWQVEFGDKSIREWLASDTCPVSLNTWYRRNGRFMHDPMFQRAQEQYRRVGQRWLVAEEERSIGDALRDLRLGARRAARRMLDLVDNGTTDGVRLRASEQVLDRADVAVGSKAPSQRPMMDLTDDELLAIVRGGGGAGDAAPAGSAA